MPMITPTMQRAAQAASSISNIAASSSSTATLPPQDLPPLAAIALDSGTLSRISEPLKKISSEEDVERWKQSESYANYLLFLQRVCEASVGKSTRLPASPLASDANDKQEDAKPMQRLIKMLYVLNSWTDEIEPQSKPQRFGNLAFRDWGARLAERIDKLHADLLPLHLHAFIPELRAYLLDAFGSFTRIDYGSGHELAFFAWVCFLYRLGFFSDQRPGEDSRSTMEDRQVEEELGLEIFPLYLMVVWRLQDRYGLEPAGSHGVWGLDDYQFLPYVIGAAQLRTQSTLRPHQIVTASSHRSILTEQLGADRSPQALISTSLTLPSSLLTPTSSNRDEAGGEAVAVPNLYLSSLLRIAVLKRGPFHEHSPLLHDIATTVPNWVKVYGGMLKMYCAECLGKKVVVQHFPFGGVGFVWNDAPVVVTGNAAAAKGPAGAGMALGGGVGNMGSMGVPTARVTTGMPGTSFSRPAPGPNAARLGSALGLGPRLGQTGRPSSTYPTARPAAGTGSGMAIPPLRMPAPTSAPAAARNAPKPNEDRPSS